MPEYTRDELDYDVGHALSCICVKCEARRNRINACINAMRGVTTDPPEGAVRKLVAVAQAIEWVPRESGTDYLFCPKCGESRLYGHATDCELDAALSRFRVKDGGGA